MVLPQDLLFSHALFKHGHPPLTVPHPCAFPPPFCWAKPIFFWFSMTILLLISRCKLQTATHFPLLAKEPTLILCGSVFARLRREKERIKSRTCSSRREHETEWAGIAAEAGWGRGPPRALLPGMLCQGTGPWSGQTHPMVVSRGLCKAGSPALPQAASKMLALLTAWASPAAQRQ